MEKATFAAGCFWGVEAKLRQVKGVKDAAVGYMGGSLTNPSYEAVCTDETGHAEVVQVDFDPAEVTYAELLEVFFKLHDPTQLNYQGPDEGTQYRTAIFYHTPEQEKAARMKKVELAMSGRYDKPVVTEVTPATVFWRAEEYHQRYLEKSGRSPCGI